MQLAFLLLSDAVVVGRLPLNVTGWGRKRVRAE